MSKPIHHAFNVDYNGIARELRTKVKVRDSISSKELELPHGIWDTGATNSAISNEVVSNLGLIPTGQIEVYTADGRSIANTYVIDLLLPNQVIIKELNVSDGDLGPNTEMLIGMDVIGLGDFIVQNVLGKTQFSFCYPPFENKLNMVEKANTLNSKHYKW